VWFRKPQDRDGQEYDQEYGQEYDQQFRQQNLAFVKLMETVTRPPDSGP
jgi:hypothetical protein